MSIAAFYRTWLPVVAHYTYMDTGRPENYYTPVTYIKGNIQPWKAGEAVQPLTGGGLQFNDYQLAYIKKEPVFDLTNLPAGAKFVRLFTYLDNKWFAIMNNQNWTRAGRAVKHNKWFISATSGATAPSIPTPTPFGELVDSFDSAIRELQQVTPILTEQLN